MKKVRTFAPAFSKEPHSSSGPGHLPLTQKIISSTLICGTKAIKSHDFVAFFILLQPFGLLCYHSGYSIDCVGSMKKRRHNPPFREY